LGKVGGEGFWVFFSKKKIKKKMCRYNFFGIEIIDNNAIVQQEEQTKEEVVVAKEETRPRFDKDRLFDNDPVDIGPIDRKKIKKGGKAKEMFQKVWGVVVQCLVFLWEILKTHVFCSVKRAILVFVLCFGIAAIIIIFEKIRSHVNNSNEKDGSGDVEEEEDEEQEEEL
jgi:hypothetical protein